MRIIVITFKEPVAAGEPVDTNPYDREVYGPFDDMDTAWAWADRFQRWFDDQHGIGQRYIVNMACLPLQSPARAEEWFRS